MPTTSTSTSVTFDPNESLGSGGTTSSAPPPPPPPPPGLTVVGTTGNDWLVGGLGDDTMTGLAGNDYLIAGNGNDTLVGGAGSDTLYGGNGGDHFVVDNGSATDRVMDWTGDDVIDLTGVDNVFAMTDLAISVANTTNAKIVAGAATIVLNQVAASSLVADDFVFRARDAAVTAVGTDAADNLAGGSGDDLLSGGAGNDQLAGNYGADVLNGGAGDDVMSGGSGGDTFVVATGDGNDTVNDWSDGDRLDLSGLADVFVFADLAITGNQVTAGGVTLTLNGLTATNLTADDVLFGVRDAALVLTGTSANETFRGGSGDDSLDAGAGNDVVSGYYGADTLRGNAGNDKVYGGLGADSVFGGSGNDTVQGGAGDDLVRGGNNSDQLFGGDGDDAVDGETGNDVLTGGLGADRFAFDDGDGSDTITDYTEDDILDLTGVTSVHGLADLVLGATGFTAGDVSVDIGAAGMATLDASDFLFA